MSHRRSKKLTKRVEVLLTPGDHRRWSRRAKELALGTISTYMRYLANEDMARAKSGTAR